MRILIILLWLVVFARAEELILRDYDAGAFLIRYKAPAKVDPVFTRVFRDFSDREDGAVFITSDPPGGLFGTKPGQKGLSIYVLPAARFGLSHPDPAELVTSLPPKLQINHPGTLFSGRLREVTSRQWSEIVSRTMGTNGMITNVAYYSFADPEHLLYVSWNFSRPISPKRWAELDPVVIETLGSFKIEPKGPSKSSPPTLLPLPQPIPQAPHGAP